MKNERFISLTNGLKLNPPSSLDVLIQFQSGLEFSPPADYIEFMTQMNGGEGSVGKGSYLVLWKVEDIKSWNEGYAVNEFAPGLVLFASDGGDTAYAFDTRYEPVKFVEVPFIGIDLSEVRTIGGSFVEFLEHLLNK